MGFQGCKKFLSSLLLIPLAFLFLSCCCLKADAATFKKSNCASCPKQETPEHQANCPHALLKAVVDADLAVVQVAQVFSFLPGLISLEPSILPRHFERIILQQLDTAQHHPSLYSQNPILRV